MASLRAYLFGHLLILLDAFSFQLTSKVYFFMSFSINYSLKDLQNLGRLRRGFPPDGKLPQN